MKREKQKSLYKRLNLLMAVILIPMMILALSLIILLVNFCNSYNQIVRNINTATKYSAEFKTDIDYTIYRVVVGSFTMDELKEQGEIKETSTASIKDPYRLIVEGKADFEELNQNVTNAGNIKRGKNIIKLLDILNKRVMAIEENTKISGKYDDNIEMWEMDIMVLTSLIQEYVQSYIYYETQSLEVIRVRLLDQEKIVLVTSTAAFVLILMISLGVSRRITKSVANPIKKLCEATEKVAQGDFTTEIVIESGDELQGLTSSVNDMKDKIGGLIEDIRIEQDNLRATELKLLQAQINPHFLYNTLDTIVWLAEGKKTEDVVGMVTHLSDFFRTVLSEGEDYISIREEQMHVRSYLSIQQVRYQDILEYSIDIERSIYSYMLLKLTLQPLVENALYHGIKKQRGMGKITVRGYEEGGDICFQVEDNGIGMSREKLQELRKKVVGKGNTDQRGFGLANVEERIRMNYGEGYGLIFESEEGVGTIVTVRIPKKNKPLSKKNIQI